MIIVSEIIEFDNPKDLRILKYVDEHNSTIENVVKDIFAYLNGKL